MEEPDTFLEEYEIEWNEDRDTDAEECTIADDTTRVENLVKDERIAELLATDSKDEGEDK